MAAGAVGAGRAPRPWRRAAVAAASGAAAAGGGAALAARRRRRAGTAATSASGARLARRDEGEGAAAVRLWRPAADVSPMFVHREVFVDECYLQHGVTLREGDIVVDVGANVGLFALFASRRVGARGAVLAFEPAPDTFECLERNIAEECAARPNGAAGAGRVYAQRLAVSDQRRSLASVTVYPQATGWSTLEPAPASVAADVAAFAKSGGDVAGEFVPGGAGAFLRRALPAGAIEAVGSVAARVLMRGAYSTPCTVCSLPEALACDGSPLAGKGNRGKPIALLKVDVERHEMDVLRGIDARTWRRIRQVAMEVHDTSGSERDRVAAAEALLRKRGFRRVTVTQPPELSGSDLYNIFAVR